MIRKEIRKKTEQGNWGYILLGPMFGILYLVLLPLIGLLTLLLALPQYAHAKKPPVVESGEMCMSCHASKDLSKVFKNKDKLSMFVNEQDFTSTVHGFLSCTDCHQKVSLSSHPGGGAALASRAAFVAEASSACRTCHPDDQLAKKPHHAALANQSNAPPCSDCHGAHNVRRISEWKPAQSSTQYCLICHQQKISKTFKSGEKLSLAVDASKLGGSVHSSHACNDCHAEFSRTSHPVIPDENRRSHSVSVSGGCRKCHTEKFEKMKGSIHYKGHFEWGSTLVGGADVKTPVCTDCHGFHDVGPKSRFDTLSGVPCRKCHEEVFKVYSGSVHGMAKAKGVHKAPLCSSCHFEHEINTAAMAEKIKAACLGCHRQVETAHEKWLPNAGLHLSNVACAACHSPKSGKGISLRLYDENTGSPFTQEQIAALLGTTSDDIARRLSAHGEGIDSYELWNIVSLLNERGVGAKVTFLGSMDLTDGREAHALASKGGAVRECESCHSADSPHFRNVTVAVVKADGSRAFYKAQPEVLGSVVSLLSLKQFYALGSTRLKVLDWVGIAMVLGGAAVPVAHISARILTRRIRQTRKMSGMRKEK